MSKLDDFLRDTRVTQASLAEKVGISRGYMSELVGGSKAPGRKLAVAIERATGGAVPVSSWEPENASGAAP